jgi:hypothetical protein
LAVFQYLQSKIEGTGKHKMPYSKGEAYADGDVLRSVSVYDHLETSFTRTASSGFFQSAKTLHSSSQFSDDGSSSKSKDQIILVSIRRISAYARFYTSNQQTVQTSRTKSKLTFPKQFLGPKLNGWCALLLSSAYSGSPIQRSGQGGHQSTNEQSGHEIGRLLTSAGL